jgi:hypothetical protein
MIVDTGGNLVLELVVKTSGNQPMPKDWPVDAQWFPRTATAEPFGAACSQLGANIQAWASAVSFSPGHTATFFARGTPGQLAFLAIGLSDKSFNGLPLPYDLSNAGAPGCSLYTDWLMLSAHVTDIGTSRWFGDARLYQPLPLDLSLLDGTLFCQWLFHAPGTNALGICTSNGVKIRLERALPDNGVGLVASRVPDAEEGLVMTHLTTVFRLGN